jgi:hypothetical protein
MSGAMFTHRARRVILALSTSTRRVQEVYIVVGHVFRGAPETLRGLV